MGVQGYDGADFGVFRYSYDPETQASQHSLTNNPIIADIRPRDSGQPAAVSQSQRRLLALLSADAIG